MSAIAERLLELGIELPQPSQPVANYVPFVRAGDLLFIAGQLPRWNGELRYIGKLGREFGVVEGQKAARLCGLNILSHLRVALDDNLDRVARCVRVSGFVNSDPAFENQPTVVDGVSDLMVQVFGDAGRHARTAVGVSALPGSVAIEVEATFEVR